MRLKATGAIRADRSDAGSMRTPGQRHQGRLEGLCARRPALAFQKDGVCHFSDGTLLLAPPVPVLSPGDILLSAQWRDGGFLLTFGSRDALVRVGPLQVAFL